MNYSAINGLYIQKIISILRKWNVPYITKSILVTLDILVINLSAFIALFVRYNMDIREIPDIYAVVIQELWWMNTMLTLAVFIAFRLYSSLWRYASVRELINVVQACIVSTVVNAALIYLTGNTMFITYYIIYTVNLLIMTFVSRFTYRLARMIYRSSRHGEKMRNTMIIGGGEACAVVMNELSMSPMLDARVCCVIDDNKKKQGTYIRGVKIVGGRDSIAKYVAKYEINEIIIALPSVKKMKSKKSSLYVKSMRNVI